MLGLLSSQCSDFNFVFPIRSISLQVAILLYAAKLLLLVLITSSFTGTIVVKTIWSLVVVLGLVWELVIYHYH